VTSFPRTYGVITLQDNQLAGFTIQGMPTLSGWDMTTGFGSPRLRSLSPPSPLPTH